MQGRKAGKRELKRLKSADTDGDNHISRVEMEIQLQKRFTKETEKAHKRFERADLNGDGYVTPEERKRVSFERLDRDRDGYLSAEEMANTRKRGKTKKG